MGLNIRRKFSDDDKIKILQEGSINGVTQTLRKYGIGQSLFYKWKRAFVTNGVTALSVFCKPFLPNIANEIPQYCNGFSPILQLKKLHSF